MSKEARCRHGVSVFETCHQCERAREGRCGTCGQALPTRPTPEAGPFFDPGPHPRDSQRDDDPPVAVAGYPGVRARFCQNCSNHPCTCRSRYDADPCEPEHA